MKNTHLKIKNKDTYLGILFLGFVFLMSTKYVEKQENNSKKRKNIRI